MNKEDFRAAILEMPTFDTHTHLVGGRLAARDFWEIAEYSWFRRELEAVGYPIEAKALPEEDRLDLWAQAWQATRNTTMNWVVRTIFKDLYGIELSDRASVRLAAEAVAQSAQQSDWVSQVASRTGLKKIGLNEEKDYPFPELPGIAVWFPRVDALLNRSIQRAFAAEDQRSVLEEAANQLTEVVQKASEKGAPGIMTSLPRIEGNSVEPPVINRSGNTLSDLTWALLHHLCGEVESHGLFLQLFLGIEKGWNSKTAPVNDTNRIVQLHGLFERYSNQFELVMGSELNNLDVVQAAILFRNVYVGGMWWYNFRESTYRESMQRRVESLPPQKCSLIISDARCFEWCYGKIALIKILMADFLFERLQSGWIDESGALQVARYWLYESAAERYT